MHRVRLQSPALTAPMSCALMLAAVGCSGGDSGVSADEASGQDSTSSQSSSSEAESGGETGGDPLLELSDEFDDPGAPSGWMLRHLVEGTPAQYDRLEVIGGALEIEPTSSGWFGDNDAPFLFKLVEGDFVFEVQLVADDRDELGTSPEELFNNVGLLARDPANGPGTENWIMHDVGQQAGTIASEGKTTVDSLSISTFMPGAAGGRVRLCRIGQDMELARWLDGDAGWNVTHTFPRADFPSEIQVGLVVNAWNSSGIEPDPTRSPDLLGRFEYARFWTPASFEACDQPASD